LVAAVPCNMTLRFVIPTLSHLRSRAESLDGAGRDTTVTCAQRRG
jgi:hypothetical protein